MRDAMRRRFVRAPLPFWLCLAALQGCFSSTAR